MMRNCSLITKCMTSLGFASAVLIIPCLCTAPSYATSHKIEGVYWASAGVPIGLEVNFFSDSTGSYNPSSRFSELNTAYKFIPHTVGASPVVCDYSSKQVFGSLTPNSVGYNLRFNLTYDPDNPCQSITQSFSPNRAYVDTDTLSNNPILDWINNDFGYQSDRDFFVQYLSPYWFRGNGFNLSPAYSDGTNFGNSFDLYEDLIGGAEYILPFYDLSLPVYDSSIDTDCNIVSTVGRQAFRGSFLLEDTDTFPFVDNSTNVDSNNSTSVLQVVYYDNDGSFGILEYPLTYQFERFDWGIRWNLRSEFVYSSSYLNQYDNVMVRVVLKFRDSNNEPVYLFKSRKMNFNSNWYFNIDNPNDVSECSVGTHVTGSHVSGVVDNPADENDGSFFYQLTHLFDFTFVNPFTPFLALFTDGSSCASIPTIASMLNSPTSTVCPWFPSSVREVVTPVVGLFSMMIVFGFVMRWLGSTSGNMFSDASSEDITHFSYDFGSSEKWHRTKKKDK